MAITCYYHDVLIIHCSTLDHCHMLSQSGWLAESNLTVSKFGVFVKEDICQRLAKSEHNLTHLSEAHATPFALKRVGSNCAGSCKLVVCAEDEPSTPRQKAAPMSFRMSPLFQSELSQGQTQSLDVRMYSWRYANMLRLPNLPLPPLALPAYPSKIKQRERRPNGITNMMYCACHENISRQVSWRHCHEAKDCRESGKWCKWHWRDV